MNKPVCESVCKRFLRYVSFPTMSNEKSITSPSTKKQLMLSATLRDELSSLGLSAELDEYGYVYGTLEANVPLKNSKPPVTVGFIAHVDTSDAAPDEIIRPSVVEYNGGNIVLNAEKGIVLKAADNPALKSLIGKHLIVTDGTTLLGADDKAGVAEIVTALEKLIKSNLPHGRIKIAFTPDEEIGRGTEHFDVKKFGADYAYTVDGDALGSLEYENFNASSAAVTVNGISTHPGDAFGKMKNASLIAFEFDSLLNADELPQKTKDREGFHHLTEMWGNVSRAELNYILRDHDFKKLEDKKKQFAYAEKVLNSKYGDGTVSVNITDTYRNMKEIIDRYPYIVSRAESAMIKVGIVPTLKSIRGGTDGAMLSFLGLPCPNICTGGQNYHSLFEYVPVEDMEKISDLLCTMMADTAEF